MTFCAIIPDRGDRKELTEHCLWQLSRMTLKPDQSYNINYKPESDRFDLTERVKQGWKLAKQDGIEWCCIVENDDFYPADYFETIFSEDKSQYSFIGNDMTTYYNLKNKTWRTWRHNLRASLFTTCFKTDVMDDFRWSNGNTPFLDVSIWEYAELFTKHFIYANAIGIKHGLGKCGGKGHKMIMENQDNNLEYLKSIVDKESFEFYSKLKV
jgi:hypothetical protein